MAMGEWLAYIRFEPLTHLFRYITFLGNAEFIYALLPILYWCWRKKTIAHLMVLVIIAAYLNFLLKGAIGMERPPTELWLIDARGYTFPSGHALLSTIIWGYLALDIRKRWFTALAIVIVVLVSLSRIYLGVHHPQDVVVGIAFGAILLLLFRWIRGLLEESLPRVNDIIKGVSVLIVSFLMLIPGANIMVAGSAGMFAGVACGYLIEQHFADFDPRDKWYLNIVKSVLGVGILVAIWYGLGWALPTNAGFEWFQSFIIGVGTMAGAPWLFVQLRLAKRES